jgi:hypothetical protein
MCSNSWDLPVPAPPEINTLCPARQAANICCCSEVSVCVCVCVCVRVCVCVDVCADIGICLLLELLEPVDVVEDDDVGALTGLPTATVFT